MSIENTCVFSMIILFIKVKTFYLGGSWVSDDIGGKFPLVVCFRL